VGVIEQGGRSIRTQNGVVKLVDLTQPYHPRPPDGTDGWSVKIPVADLLGPPG
jgi:hypothetical protein